MKKVLSYSPEAVVVLAVLQTAAVVVLGRTQGPAFTGGVRALLILAVLGAVSCWPLSVMLYAARPSLFGRAATTAWIGWAVPVLFVLPALALIPVGSTLLAMSVHPTAYEPRVLILILAWGSCLTPAVLLLVMRGRPGPSRRLAGPLRAWHLAILLLAAMGVAAWPLAAYNPTLRHSTLALRVVRTTVGGLTSGDPCRLQVGWFPGAKGARCKLDLLCGERQLYGGYKKGVFDCTVRDRGLVIQGRDDDPDDGDPALSIDTIKGTGRLEMPGGAALELELPREAL